MRRYLSVPTLLLLSCSQQNFDFKAVEALNGLAVPTITINGGAKYTNNLGVTLTTQSPDTRWMQLSNEKDCSNATGWTDQASDIAWTLKTENADNSVFAKFRSRNGFETDCVSASIVHDNKNPSVDIIERPRDLSDTSRAQFKFEGRDDGSGIDYFECQLTSGGYVPCPPSVVYGNLPEGFQTMLVRAVDRAGNRSLVKDAQWMIDTLPPEVFVMSGPPASSNSSSATFTFRADDRSGSGVDKIVCRVGPLSFDPCNSPLFLPSLAQGTYNLQIWATDRVAHTSPVVTYTWAVDNVPSGEFTIVGVDQPPVDLTIDTWLKGVNPRAHWTKSDGAMKYYVSILDMNDQIVCAEQMTGALLHDFGASCALNDLSVYKVRVTADDGAGNRRTNTLPFVVDRTPPAIAIAAPALSGDQKQATIAFTVSDQAPGVLKDVVCYLTQIENGALKTSQRACNGQSSIAFTNLPLGDHTFKIVASDVAGNVSEKQTTWQTKQVICDPFAGDTSLCKGGLVGELYYLNDEQQARFKASSPKTVEFYFSEGTKINAIVNLMSLFGTTRRFNLGFPTSDGSLVKDDQGNTLVEYFAFKLRSLVLLDVDNADPSMRDQPGEYQFATISDDGSILHFQPVIGGPYSQLVNNDGNHSTQMGCASRSVTMQPETRLPIMLDYYQGPRDYIAMTLMWRRVPAGDLSDPLCGVTGANDMFYGPYPHDNFTNAYGYGQLRERGWKVLGERNFIAPQ